MTHLPLCLVVAVLAYSRLSLAQIITADSQGNIINISTGTKLTEISNNVVDTTEEPAQNVVSVNTRVFVNECTENSVDPQCQDIQTIAAPEAPNLIIAATATEEEEDDDEEEEDDDDDTETTTLIPSSSTTDSTTESSTSSSTSTTASTSTSTSTTEPTTSTTEPTTSTTEPTTSTTEPTTSTTEPTTSTTEPTTSTTTSTTSTTEQTTPTEQPTSSTSPSTPSSTEAATSSTTTQQITTETVTTAEQVTTEAVTEATTASTTKRVTSPTVSSTSTPSKTTDFITTESLTTPSSTTTSTTTTKPSTSSTTSTTPTTTSTTPTTRTPTTTSTTAATTTTVPMIEQRVSSPPSPTTRRPPSMGICSGCRMKNGVGYSAHPTDCSRFYQCVDAGVKLIPVERSCPFGLRWNQKILVCDFPNNVKCGQDVCPSSGYIPIPGNCRGFWDCYGGTAISKCCPYLMAFDPLSGGCSIDVKCYDECGAYHRTGSDTSVTSGRCNMRSVSGDSFSYEQNDGTGSWILQKCPAMTVFNPSYCGCAFSSRQQAVDKQKCQPELLLTFDKDTMDTSGKKHFVKNTGVLVSNGAAFFNGKSSLMVHRFANAWFGQTVIIKLRYQAFSPTRQGLVCNGNCDVAASIYIGTNIGTSTEFSVKTYNSAANFTLMKSNTEWQDVTYTLKDGVLNGRVGSQTSSQNVKGSVETRQRALVIGGCEGAQGFKGIIDEVAVYLCDPSRA